VLVQWHVVQINIVALSLKRTAREKKTKMVWFVCLKSLQHKAEHSFLFIQFDFYPAI
jgi:hypothetical protein